MMDVSYGLMAPCKGCQERRVGCHDECPKYKEYQRLNEERKEKERRAAKRNEWGYREAFLNRNKRL